MVTVIKQDTDPGLLERQLSICFDLSSLSIVGKKLTVAEKERSVVRALDERAYEASAPVRNKASFREQLIEASDTLLGAREISSHFESSELNFKNLLHYCGITAKVNADGGLRKVSGLKVAKISNNTHLDAPISEKKLNI